MIVSGLVRAALAGACVFALSSATLAAEPVVLARFGTVSVTTQDVLADLQRAPEQSRASIASNPDTISKVASNMLVRRAFAAEAEANGLIATPAVQQAIAMARERVLAEARAAQFDATHAPKPEAIEAYARTKYKAEPKRFETPAQTHARHILVRGSGPEAKAKAGQLVADLKAGADFAALAKEHSADPGSAAKGGDLGFFAAGRMVKPFDDALAALKSPGEISAPVETEFGWHIIKLEARRDAGVRSYDEVREALHREASLKILSDLRIARAKEIVDAAKFDNGAIAAFAQSQAKK